jgi:hypothetical protein
MRLSQPMLWGAVFGAFAGVAGTIISIFQFDSTESTRGEIVAAGLLIGVPVAMAGGAGAGWVWGLFFKKDGSSDQRPATGRQRAAREGSAPRDQVGHWQGDARRRKRR